MHVTLPKTVQTTADVNEQPLQLGIDAQGVMTINKIPMADLPTLEIALKAELEKNPEIGVHLYADQSVIYSKLAEVMATVQHAGVAKLAFVTLEN